MVLKLKKTRQITYKIISYKAINTVLRKDGGIGLAANESGLREVQ